MASKIQHRARKGFIYCGNILFNLGFSCPSPFFSFAIPSLPPSLPFPLPLFFFPLPLLSFFFFFKHAGRKSWLFKAAGKKNQGKCIYLVIQGERRETVQIWMDTVSARTPDKLHYVLSNTLNIKLHYINYNKCIKCYINMLFSFLDTTCLSPS